MSLVKLEDNSTKTEPRQTIKVELSTNIKELEELDEITIKSEPFLEIESYSNVVKTEKGDKQIFTCVQCSQFFEHVELYELHISLHNQTDIKIKHCPGCQKQYQRLDRYIIHIQKHLDNYFCCTFCPQIFFNQNPLRQHIAEHKKNGALACQYCGKVFKLQKSLTLHIRVHTNERPYECGICNKWFKQLSSLRTHKELIHSKGNPQECKVCHGKFCTKSSLKRHMKLHNNGRTFTCKICKQIFLNQGLYKKHRMEKHIKIKLSRFFKICTECNEQFFTYREYYYHTRTHQLNKKLEEKENKVQYKPDAVVEKINLPSNERKVICWLCGEKVLSKTFNEHKNKHLLMTPEEVLECITRSNQFSCKRCDCTFSAKKSLLLHMISHMKKLYNCKKEFCTPYLFTYWGLKRHNRKYHAGFKEVVKLRKCFLCGLEVLRINHSRHLNDHIQMTDEDLLTYKLAKEYPCKQCKKVSPSRVLLLRHTISHMPKKFKCRRSSECDGALYTYVGLRCHQRLVHTIYL